MQTHFDNPICHKVSTDWWQQYPNQEMLHLCLISHEVDFHIDLSVYPASQPAIPYTSYDDVVIHVLALTKECAPRRSRCIIKNTLNNPITVGHNNFVEPTLILITRISVGHINFEPTLNQ